MGVLACARLPAPTPRTNTAKWVLLAEKFIFAERLKINIAINYSELLYLCGVLGWIYSQNALKLGCVFKQVFEFERVKDSFPAS